MKVTAITKKHQKNVNAFVAWNAKYDALVDQDKEETRAGENAYAKALDYWCELPKREQANIAKQIPNVKGCY
ncbi:hypothetical protein NVP1215B_041 [Vibrio phage 1.215.B._10N.222.54.F7]|nr:hypothetical protein NVP1215A_041 [Vibrio phage 1.215.A._10N.222.54.F7]AUR96064.1 hypothetical protein NVP1215B_041 [Vibrio phage 1.215.B._10N.222.54.F7]